MGNEIQTVDTRMDSIELVLNDRQIDAQNAQFTEPQRNEISIDSNDSIELSMMSSNWMAFKNDLVENGYFENLSPTSSEYKQKEQEAKDYFLQNTESISPNPFNAEPGTVDGNVEHKEIVDYHQETFL